MFKTIRNLFVPTFLVYGRKVGSDAEELMFSVKDADLPTASTVRQRVIDLDQFIPTRIERPFETFKNKVIRFFHNESRWAIAGYDVSPTKLRTRFVNARNADAARKRIAPGSFTINSVQKVS